MATSPTRWPRRGSVGSNGLASLPALTASAAASAASLPRLGMNMRDSRPPLTSSASVGYGGRGGPPLSGTLFYAAACRAHDACDLPAALQLYTTALALEPEHLGAWVGRGVARKESLQYTDAILDYTRALALSPSDSTTLLVLSNRANCLSALGQHAAALGDHNSALALNKGDAVLWCNRGSTLLKLGRLDDARVDFEKGIECDTAYAACIYNLALVLGRQGRIGECSRQFERAADIFRLSAGNAAHADDCERQLVYFTGHRSSVVGTSRARNHSPQVTLNRPSLSGASTPTTPRGSGTNTGRLALNVSPLSPVHLRGITRCFPDDAPDSPAAAFSASATHFTNSPMATPTSRAPLASHLIGSDSLESPSARRVGGPNSAQLNPQGFSLIRALAPGDQYALLTPASRGDSPAPSRSPAFLSGPSVIGPHADAHVPTLINGAMVLPLLSERRHSLPTIVPATSSSVSMSSMRTSSTPTAVLSPSSPLSGEPLLSPNAKSPLPAVKPPTPAIQAQQSLLHGHGSKMRSPVRFHTNYGALTTQPI